MTKDSIFFKLMYLFLATHSPIPKKVDYGFHRPLSSAALHSQALGKGEHVKE